MLLCKTLDDQTQVDSKPVDQPEHASPNQCHLIAANWCSGHPQQVVEIRFLCNVIDARALIGPCSHVTSRCCQSVTPGMSPACNYRAYSNWSLATYPFFSSSKVKRHLVGEVHTKANNINVYTIHLKSLFLLIWKYFQFSTSLFMYTWNCLTFFF